MKFLSVFFIFALIFVKYSEQHGRLLDPAARSSAWRKQPSIYPAYYNDMEMFCGGAAHQWQQNGGKCSICGESYTANPKQFEKGGKYYVGISIREYTVGQTFDVHVELTANHLGWFEFRLCNIDGWAGDATQECLDKTLLKDEKGDTRFSIASGVYNFYKKLVLPPDVTCKQCVFQWKYNTGNSWGTDTVTGQSCLGCGPGQEQFYGCSDITIRSGGIDPIVTTTAAPETTASTTRVSTVSSTTASTASPTTASTASPTTASTASPTTGSTASQTTASTASTTKPTVQTTAQQTVSSSTVQSTTTAKPEITSGQCKYGDGYYPDLTTNCSRYFVCYFTGTVNQQVVYFNCPAGLLFDYNGQLCNYPSQVSCVPY